MNFSAEQACQTANCTQLSNTQEVQIPRIYEHIETSARRGDSSCGILVNASQEKEIRDILEKQGYVVETPYAAWKWINVRWGM